MKRPNYRSFGFALISASVAGCAGSSQTVKTVEPAISEQRLAAAQFIKPFFNDLDCEGVGVVQSGEVDEHFSPIMLSLDSDQSHYISRQELLSYPHMHDKQLLAKSYNSADLNSDGQLSVLELLGYMNRAIDELDSDGDGEVQRSELDSVFPDK